MWTPPVVIEKRPEYRDPRNEGENHSLNFAKQQYPLRCMDRFCPHCAGTRSAFLQGRYSYLCKKVVEQKTSTSLYIATLTWPIRQTLPSKEALQHLREGAKWIFKRLFAADGGFLVWEVSPGSEHRSYSFDRFHLHCHAVFSSRETFPLVHRWNNNSKSDRDRRKRGSNPPLRITKHLQECLTDMWGEVLSEVPSIDSETGELSTTSYGTPSVYAQDVQQVSSNMMDVRELCKYLTGTDISKITKSWIAKVWQWYRGRPAIVPWGRFRKVKFDDQEAIEEEIAIAEAIEHDVCPSCKEEYDLQLVGWWYRKRNCLYLKNIKEACVYDAKRDTDGAAMVKRFNRVDFYIKT